VSGFTLTGNAPYDAGAALNAVDATVTIRDVNVTGCTGPAGGDCGLAGPGLPSATLWAVVHEFES